PPHLERFPYTTLFRSCLDLALGLDLQFQADLACQIDVEPGKATDLVGEIERRKVDRGENPQPHEVRQVGPRQALAGIEQDRRRRDRKSTRLNSSHVKI